mmetsp:Transcript_17976/g.17330  ORF Transcript_17976/g.17330 Transcript_17976/m.17330 type:complete len:277 (-) Transcript_17976:73-903(-)
MVAPLKYVASLNRKLDTLAASDLERIGGRPVFVLSILFRRIESSIPNMSGTIPASSVSAPRRSIVCSRPLAFRAFSAFRGPVKTASPPIASAASFVTPEERPIDDRMTTWRRVELEDAASISAKSLMERSSLSAVGTEIEQNPSSPSELSFCQTISLCEASHKIAVPAPSNAARRVALPVFPTTFSTTTISSHLRGMGDALPPTMVMPPRSHLTDAASASDRTIALIIGNSSVGICESSASSRTCSASTFPIRPAAWVIAMIFLWGTRARALENGK